MPVVLPYRGKLPLVAPSAYVAPNATLVGDLEIGDDASIWFGAVLRGDVMPLRIGARTSIQDNSVVHATTGWAPTLVGADCTVGHGVILHGCTIHDRVLVGMGSIVMDGAEVGPDVILGAGSLVTARTRIPPGSMAYGRPAAAVRPLTEVERAQICRAAEQYLGYKSHYVP